jgi:hypothetical protein
MEALVMKYNEINHRTGRALAVLPLVIPSVAYASGGDILSLMWIELGLFIAILIFTFLSKLAIKYRAIVFFIYVISVIVAMWSTSSLPYSDNIVFINSTSILLPIGACLLGWRWCVKQSKT